MAGLQFRVREPPERRTANPKRSDDLPLGNKCPSCGKQTYHKDGPVLRCSACGAVGWIGAPGAPGGGRGKKCQRCEGSTLRSIVTVRGVQARHCYACSSTFLVG